MLTFDQLHAAMMRLARRHGLARNYTAYPPTERTRRRNQVESVAHELAHGLCLGGVAPTRAINRRVHSMDDRRADAHELRALRVEGAALRRLGVRIATYLIPGEGTFRRGKPEPEQFAARLNRHERRLVDRFVSIVRETARELEAAS
jgi:hypothetical protein